MRRGIEETGSRSGTEIGRLENLPIRSRSYKNDPKNSNPKNS